MTGARIVALWRIWGTPLILALLTLASLVGALIVEGVWDWIATLVLFGILAFAVGKGWRGRSREDRPLRSLRKGTS